MISYGKQSIDQSDIDAVVKVLNGDWLTQGPVVEKFEKDLGNYFGAKYVCAVSNGTAALHLTALALDWKPKDIIYTTTISFLATANCIRYVGATPYLIDIDPKTYTIDINKLEERIIECKNLKQRIKAIIAVDYAGHPCDWKSLRFLADKYNLQLINDNCHALGAKYYNSKKYALKYADVMTQSYHPVKHITSGEGGSVFTNDEKIDEKVRILRSHGMEKNKNLIKTQGPWYYEMQELGFNYRITDFQSALGINQLKKLNSFIDKRKKIAETYDLAFMNSPNLKIPKISDYVEHAYHLYPLQINFEKSNLDKSTFFEKMRNKGVSLQVHYIPIHTQPYYSKKYSYKSKDFRIAEDFYLKEISLPIYPSLSNFDLQKVINNLNVLLNE